MWGRWTVPIGVGHADHLPLGSVQVAGPVRANAVGRPECCSCPQGKRHSRTTEGKCRPPRRPTGAADCLRPCACVDGYGCNDADWRTTDEGKRLMRTWGDCDGARAY